jgi:hypothetical protein
VVPRRSESLGVNVVRRWRCRRAQRPDLKSVLEILPAFAP